MSKFAKANRPSDKDKNLLTHFYLELIESALTRVIVVDERISAWSKQILYRRNDNDNIIANKFQLPIAITPTRL